MGTHCVRRDESMSNGSFSLGKSIIRMADDEEEEEAVDRSHMPLLSMHGDGDVTMLSQATDTTCLSTMDYSIRQQQQQQQQQRHQRRRSLHSHDSSLHSSLGSSSGGGSSQSLRGHVDNDNINTGISRNVDHQMNDSGLVVTTAGSADGARLTSSGSSELVHTSV